MRKVAFVVFCLALLGLMVGVVVKAEKNSRTVSTQNSVLIEGRNGLVTIAHLDYFRMEGDENLYRFISDPCRSGDKYVTIERLPSHETWTDKSSEFQYKMLYKKITVIAPGTPEYNTIQNEFWIKAKPTQLGLK